MIEPNIPHTASQRWILVSTRTKLQSAIETVSKWLISAYFFYRLGITASYAININYFVGEFV